MPQRKLLFLFVLSLVALPFFSFSQNKNETMDYVICRLDKTVRSLRISDHPTDGCIATYTKQGVDTVVGKSKSVEVCRSIISNIRKNLNEANWNCKDNKNAKVTDSSEETPTGSN